MVLIGARQEGWKGKEEGDIFSPRAFADITKTGEEGRGEGGLPFLSPPSHSHPPFLDWGEKGEDDRGGRLVGAVDYKTGALLLSLSSKFRRKQRSGLRLDWTSKRFRLPDIEAQIGVVDVV